MATQVRVTEEPVTRMSGGLAEMVTDGLGTEGVEQNHIRRTTLMLGLASGSLFHFLKHLSK